MRKERRGGRAAVSDSDQKASDQTVLHNRRLGVQSAREKLRPDKEKGPEDIIVTEMLKRLLLGTLHESQNGFNAPRRKRCGKRKNVFAAADRSHAGDGEVVLVGGRAHAERYEGTRSLGATARWSRTDV